MDIIFELQGGNPFCIEVGYFDTVLEIKEKVQKYQNIPVAKQTIFFNGQILQDERDIEYCELFHNSRVKLIVAADAEKHPVNIEERSPSFSKKILLNIRIPTCEMLIPVEMDMQDTVGHLKEKVQQMQNVPVSRLVSHATGVALQENYFLCDYELTDNQIIDVKLRPSPTASATSSGNSTKKLKVMVLLPNSGSAKIPVEVNALDKVGELRNELQRMQQYSNFHLPLEGYFFIYRQNVMEDDRSFRWHHVNQGDTIEIFSGSVTGGV